MSNTKLPATTLHEELIEALRDALAGWRYIRMCHGDLYGVGWDRVEDKATAALSRADRERQAGEAVAWLEDVKLELRAIINGRPVDAADKAKRALIWIENASLPAPQAVQAGCGHCEKGGWCGRRDCENIAAAPSPDGKAEQAEAPNPLADYHREQYEHAHAGWEACKQECDRLRDELDAATQPTASPEQAEAPSEFTPPGECDSRELCAVNRQCAGRYDTKAICATQPTASNAGERDAFDVWLEGQPDSIPEVWNIRHSHDGHEETARFVWRAALASKPPAIDWSQAGRLMEAAMTAKAAGFTTGTTNWAAHICRAMGGKPPAGEQKPVGEGFFTPDGECINASATIGYLGLAQGDAARGCTIRPLYTASLPEQVAQDSARLDWLCEQFVTVRTPMRYGSAPCFLGSPDDNDGESVPWDIRAAIDAARARGEGGGAA